MKIKTKKQITKMFSSFLPKLFETNMNFLSSFLYELVDNNITSDELTDDCSWADELGMNNVPVNVLTEVITDELSEVTSDEMPGFDDNKEFYPNNL